MHYRYFKAVASCAAAIAFATTTPVINAADWTSFTIGQLGSSFTYAHRPDGRFVFGADGKLFTQDVFGSATKTQVSNTGSVVFDPSFVAVRNDTSGLIGGGGFSGPSGLFGFDPSSPATAVVGTAVATLQNYCAVYWKHPTSGREGWLIGGTNGTAYGSGPSAGKMHNVSFVSNDGAHVGAITGDLCTYSSGIAVDAAGNFYTALFELAGAPNVADAEKVMKFTAAQVDAAVAAVISGTPAPVARSAASLVFKFASAASIAVDSQNRVWATGFKVDYLQVFDQDNGVVRNYKPDQGTIAGAAGPVAYQVQAFTNNSTGYLSFLANDSFYTGGSDLVFGYRAEAQLSTRGAWFPVTTKTVTEAAGAVTVEVKLTPAPTSTVTVPFTISGSATKGTDYTASTSPLVFTAGQTSKSITINVIDNALNEADETVIVKLGTVSPAAQAVASTTFSQAVITITDNDPKPAITTVQPFGTGRVGSAYSYQIQTTGPTPTKFTVTGLPPGMTYDAVTGLISGRPTVPGEYDQVWITASNAAGTSTSKGYIITVEDYAAAAHGTFVGLADRTGASTGGLGARVDVSTTAKGTFTGKVTIGATAYPISGPLDTSSTNPTGGASFRRGTTTIPVSITLNASTGALTGTVGSSVAVSSASITGWRATASPTSTGLHNFYASVAGGPSQAVPQGTSYGSVTVLASGVANVSGRTADGLSFSTSAPMSSGGEVLVYQSLYAVPGSFIGSLSIGSDVAHIVAGTISWSKPGQTTGTTHKNGWSPEISLVAKGGKYRPASGIGIVLNAVAGSGNNAHLALQDGGLSSSVGFDLRLATPAVVGIVRPQSLTITNSTGTFTGTITNGTGASKQVITINGLIVPDTSTPDPFDGTGEGWFLLTTAGVTRSGAVALTTLP